MPTIAGDDHARNENYSRALDAERRALDEALADIRRREDAHEITVRQAADERVVVLERHLASLRALREAFGHA